MLTLLTNKNGWIYMEQNYIEESVRARLILAGIGELEEHGITDFSLRRAALSAQVSCAAPYRHFKDKDEYIKEIIRYVASKWELLTNEIKKVFSDNPRRLAIETAIASLRFRAANSNFRSVFTLAAKGGEESVFDTAVIDSVSEYCNSRGITDKARNLKIFTVRSVISLKNDSGSAQLMIVVENTSK